MSAHLLLLFIFFVFFTSPPPTLPQSSRAFQIPHFPFLPLSPFPPDHPFPSNHSSNSPSILQSSLKLTSPSGEGQGASLPSVVHFDAGSPFAARWNFGFSTSASLFPLSLLPSTRVSLILIHHALVIFPCILILFFIIILRARYRD